MNPPKMPIHIGDYQRDTGHLRAAGHGAYLLLMFHYWSTGGLPDNDDQLSAIARMSRGEWNKHKAALRAFFDDGWKHGRIDYDLEKSRNISEAAREAGRASGRSRSAKPPLNDRSPPVEPTLEPLNHSKKEAASAASPYAFESGVIRLNQKDFDQWTKAFVHLNLPAKLLALTEWAGQQRSWFNAVASALSKADAAAKLDLARSKPAPFKYNGIEGVV